MESKVSIIIPTYNSEKTIVKCIDSIINQTYKNLEIIVIDDGSEDNTINILKEYSNEKRLFVIKQKNSGVSSARNKGVNRATGEFIVFVDSDDWLEKDMIEKMLLCQKEYNVDVVRCNYYIEQKEKSIVPSMYGLSNVRVNKNEYEIYQVFEHFFLNKEPMKNLVMLLLIKKEKILDKMNFEPNLYMMEDVYYYLKLFNTIDSIYFLDIPLYHYFENENSATHLVSKYEKNIVGIVETNSVINSYIINNKINIKSDFLNANHIRIICNYLYFIFYTFGIKKVFQIIKDIYNNKKFERMINNSNYTYISNYWKKISTNLRNKKVVVILFLIRKLTKGGNT